jgi:hypothetical protein
MIVEERDYTLKAGKLGAFVETYRDRGPQIQLEISARSTAISLARSAS